MPHNNRKAAKNDVVYMVRRESDGAIKFGITSNPKRRIQMLAAEHKSKMTPLGYLPGSYGLEGTILDYFKEHELYNRGTGHPCEWLKPAAAVLAFAEKMHPTTVGFPVDPQSVYDMQLDIYKWLEAQRAQRQAQQTTATSTQESAA